MIAMLLTALKTAGVFVSRFMQDYISNIIVGTLLFPTTVLKQATIAYNQLLSPLIISF